MLAVETFKANLAEVDRLIHFDREILQIMEMTVQDLHDQLRPKFADERLNGGRALRVVKGIRENETVRVKFQAIYNQATVLLVSHFASALGDLFRDAVAVRLGTADPGKVLDEDFKISVAEMRDRDWNFKAAVPELLIAKHDFTFQDMQATVRAFQNYAGRAVPRDVVMNNIIAAQACRHVIVHAGGRVTERAVKQVSNASPRTLKPLLQLGEQVQFTLAEVEQVKSDMLTFIETLGSSGDSSAH